MRAKVKASDELRLYVGVEPGYVREIDVITQIEMMYPDFHIFRSLDEMVDELIEMIVV